jgi:hypothetical protein
MAGVLSGLLVVQIIWIKRGIELKEQQFTENVHVALNEVALMLERQEAYDMFQQGLLNENDFPNSSIFNSSTGEDELKLITDIQSDSGSGYKITFNYDTAIIKGADGSRHLSKRVSISVCDTLIDVSEKMTNKQRMMNDLFSVTEKIFRNALISRNSAD